MVGKRLVAAATIFPPRVNMPHTTAHALQATFSGQRTARPLPLLPAKHIPGSHPARNRLPPAPTRLHPGLFSSKKITPSCPQELCQQEFTPYKKFCMTSFANCVIGDLSVSHLVSGEKYRTKALPQGLFSPDPLKSPRFAFPNPFCILRNLFTCAPLRHTTWHPSEVS